MCIRDSQRPGHLVAIERQARLRARAVTRGQAAGLHAQALARRQQRVPQIDGAVGVDEQLIGHALAGVAGARQDEVKAARVGAHDSRPGQRLQPLGEGRVAAGQSDERVGRARPLQGDVHPAVGPVARVAQIAQLGRVRHARPRPPLVNQHPPLVDRIQPGPILSLIHI